mgnify:CR=1 FL=1
MGHYSKLLNEMVTGWERTLETQEAREVELKGTVGSEVVGTAVGMANDQLRHCIEMTRQLMTDCTRMDNHENTIAGMIENLTK